jgi:hypothetical protein
MSNAKRTSPIGRTSQESTTHALHVLPGIKYEFELCSNRVRIITRAGSMIDNRHRPGA